MTFNAPKIHQITNTLCVKDRFSNSGEPWNWSEWR